MKVAGRVPLWCVVPAWAREKHYVPLKKIADRHSVDLHYLMAIWGGETAMTQAHAFRVTEDRNVGVVRDEDQLATFLYLADAVHDRLEDEPVVKVVFRLVDDQRILAVEQEDR